MTKASLWKKFVEEAEFQVLTSPKSRRRYEKMAETETEVSILRDGIPLYFRKERKRGRISRNKYFRTKEYNPGDSRKILHLYDNEGIRFGKRIEDEDASRKIRDWTLVEAVMRKL